MTNDPTNAAATDMQLVFEQEGTFEAMWAAEAWCRENGISCGSPELGKPRGLLRGDFVISKWHNMSRDEIAALDGRMTGDMRTGPVTINLRSCTTTATGPS